MRSEQERSSDRFWSFFIETVKNRAGMPMLEIAVLCEFVQLVLVKHSLAFQIRAPKVAWIRHNRRRFQARQQREIAWNESYMIVFYWNSRSD